MAELIRDGKPSRELYRDPDFGFIQMGHVHKQGHGNLPHDHGPYGVVYGAYTGVTEITKYKSTDDGSKPNRDSGKRKARSALAGCGSAILARRYPFNERGPRPGCGFSFPQL